MKKSVVDQQGKKAGTIELSEAVFGAPVNESLLAQAVRVYQANQRQGTASTKTRGEIVGSRRKIWPQKGTGRARHGDRYAPIFVGGGRAHGPKPKDWSLRFSKKMKRRALAAALSDKVGKERFLIVDRIEIPDAKTRRFASFLDQALEEKADSVLVVLDRPDEKTYRAGRNIPGVEITTADQVNALAVLRSEVTIFVKGAVDRLHDRLTLSAARPEKPREKAPPPPDLDLSKRVLSALEKAGVDSPSQLRKMDAEEIAAIKGIGPKALAEIEVALQE